LYFGTGGIDHNLPKFCGSRTIRYTFYYKYTETYFNFHREPNFYDLADGISHVTPFEHSDNFINPYSDPIPYYHSNLDITAHINPGKSPGIFWSVHLDGLVP